MKLLFISLGCDKNLVDAEKMLGLIEDEHFEICDDEAEADIIVINTCCFIADAKEESVNTILEMAEYKHNGNLKALIVTGCLSQRYQKDILDEIPEVDAVLGTNSYDDIIKAIDKALKKEKYLQFKELKGIPEVRSKRILTTGGHYAHLKIAEGCDKNCTYCIIPSLRGSYRSVPMEDVIAEAEALVADGAKEIILVAQETTLYGVDLYGRKSLGLLLDKLNEIPGLVWIKIQYCYPEEIDDDLIAAIKRNDKVCHYLDLPIQHCSDDILRRMARRTNKADIVEKVKKLREEIPDICLRTTLICGFPGETDENHDELMRFINEMEFDRLGCFAYSAEEDTPAFSFPNQVDEEKKKDWVDDVMVLQQEISCDINEKFIGKEMWAMIEGKVADENAYVARTYRDAPGVDGLVFVNTDEMLVTGDFVKVKITAAFEYDLMGELV
ncbi:MAG: 30S ribosomal protein S12 methylthiotransferase RimO [Lachnospiraceae bacterium]|nr:30S ribosomal protein S12 methylthiotransferase RimO [Lachnospiraceae bacterium]